MQKWTTFPISLASIKASSGSKSAYTYPEQTTGSLTATHVSDNTSLALVQELSKIIASSIYTTLHDKFGIDDVEAYEYTYMDCTSYGFRIFGIPFIVQVIVNYTQAIPATNKYTQTTSVGVNFVTFKNTVYTMSSTGIISSSTTAQSSSSNPVLTLPAVSGKIGVFCAGDLSHALYIRFTGRQTSPTSTNTTACLMFQRGKNRIADLDCVFLASTSSSSTTNIQYRLFNLINKQADLESFVTTNIAVNTRMSALTAYDAQFLGDRVPLIKMHTDFQTFDNSYLFIGQLGIPSGNTYTASTMTECIIGGRRFMVFGAESGIASVNMGMIELFD